MENQLYGAKELHDVTIKALSPFTFGDREVQAGEPVAVFDSIQYAIFTENKRQTDARGGFKNKSHVHWEDTDSVSLTFTQGIFSLADLALLGNAAFESHTLIKIPKLESLKTSESSSLTLSHKPIPETLFLYYEDTVKSRRRITSDMYDLVDNIVTFKAEEPEFTRVRAVYDFEHLNENKVISVGKPMANVYLELTGRTTMVDEQSGERSPAIIRIPKMKITSGFSIVLGKDVTPMNIAFSVEGYPAGNKGQERVMEVIVLDDKI